MLYEATSLNCAVMSDYSMSDYSCNYCGGYGYCLHCENCWDWDYCTLPSDEDSDSSYNANDDYWFEEDYYWQYDFYSLDQEECVDLEYYLLDQECYWLDQEDYWLDKIRKGSSRHSRRAFCQTNRTTCQTKKKALHRHIMC